MSGCRSINPTHSSPAYSARMTEENKGHTVEVCFSPVLFPFITTEDDLVVVIADILRATTSICAAFHYGAKEIIPVATLEEAREYKQRGYLVTAEREGRKPPFADFDNSPFEYQNGQVKDKSLVYCTTNGTRAIRMAGEMTGVVLGAFSNITVLASRLLRQKKNTVVLCAGWKNTFSLEDTLFAGALTSMLTARKTYEITGDSAVAALTLWQAARDNPIHYVSMASHLKRLKKLGLDDILEYAVKTDTTPVIPVFENGRLINKATSYNL